jgi:hypothetical protein
VPHRVPDYSTSKPTERLTMKRASNVLALLIGLAVSTPTLCAFVTVSSPHHNPSVPSTSLRYREGPGDDVFDLAPPAIRPHVLGRGGQRGGPSLPPPGMPARDSPFLEMGEHVGEKSQWEMSNPQSVGAIMEAQHRPSPPRRSVWETTSTVKTVQGGALRTWSMEDPHIDHVQVLLRNEGTPLHATVELWHGPDDAPFKMAVYSDDGDAHPFSCILATPGYASHSIGIRNKGPLEYPCGAAVVADLDEAFAYPDDRAASGLGSLLHGMQLYGDLRTIQGESSSESFFFPPSTESVQILVQTDGRPCHARLELTQGPDEVRQVVEVYLEDGEERPLLAVLETPGTATTVRVVNVGGAAFPITVAVEPHLVDASHAVRRGPPASAPPRLLLGEFAERVDGPPGFFFAN